MGPQANPILTNKFYTDLPLLARPRPASFGVEINNLAVGVCWAGWNIRRTPLPQIRVDDPGNNLDLAFDNAQVHTPRSAFAQSIANNLGIEYLHNIIPTLNLAHNTATAYNQQEWVPSAVSPNKLKNMNNPNNTLI